MTYDVDTSGNVEEDQFTIIKPKLVNIIFTNSNAKIKSEYIKITK